MDNLPPQEEPSGDPSKPNRSVPESDTIVTEIVSGRGRVGKTVVANTMVQFFRKHGANIRVWNGDRQNDTHNLGTYHKDALRPASDDPEEKRSWLEAGFDLQARERFDSVLDMAGGDPIVRHLAKETRMLRTLERRGIKTVSWQVLGPEIADLDYLRLSMEGGLFMPEATLLVFNTGLVRPGRSVKAAFSDVLADKVFEAAMDRGAQVVWFPALTCMTAVSDRALKFDSSDAASSKAGQSPLSFFDQARIEIFWEEAVPEFFEAIPADWLPAMPGWER